MPGRVQHNLDSLSHVILTTYDSVVYFLFYRWENWGPESHSLGAD